MSYREYKGEEITVYFDGDICKHANVVKGLPKVFNVKARPWISLENVDAKKVAEVINRCPSGALKYKM